MNEKLLAMVKAVPVSFILKDRSGRYVHIDDETARVFGRPSSGSGTAADLFPPDVAKQIADAERTVLETGETVMAPIWMPDASGNRRHFAMIKFPVVVGGETLVGGIALDIKPFSTNSWDTSTYRQILDAITDLILVKGPDSRLLWANKALLTSYGMSNAQLQGIVDAEFVEPDVSQQYVKDDQQVFATGKALDIPEEQMKWADGRVRIVHTVKSPIFDDDGNVAMSVAVIRDITDAKRFEVELRQAQKLESIGRLAAGMAHEINTPIQYVGDQRQFAQDAFEDLMGLMRRYQDLASKVEAGTVEVADVKAVRDAEAEIDLPFIEGQLATAFSSMAEGIGRVSKLVQALKEFGHPDSGGRALADLNAAIRRTVLMATNEYKYVADVELDLEAFPDIYCCVGEMQQVFLNLIVNAAHAIVDADKSRRGTIKITSRLVGTDVVFTVSDTGCGIPASVHAQIFDPFFTTKAVGRGTGQGLSICRLVVEKHHGTITFETVERRGTTFTIRMPCMLG